MFKRMHDQKGFTLIELMIVVAIIGILAAVAIPNFLKYQAKSKQSEARVVLSGIYTSEVAYFAENNAYGDWDYDDAGGATLALKITDGGIGFSPASAMKYYLTIATALAAVGGTADQTFTSVATGNIDGDATDDVWQVTDANREPSNTTNDITS